MVLIYISRKLFLKKKKLAFPMWQIPNLIQSATTEGPLRRDNAVLGLDPCWMV